MLITFTTPTAVDMSGTAATAYFTLTATKAGVINTQAIIGIIEEAVATGGFTSVAGDFTVYVGSNAVAAWSTGTTATARAIGYQANATTDATYAPNGYYKFGAGDTIYVKNAGQGAGGTVTGTARVFIPIVFDAD